MRCNVYICQINIGMQFKYPELLYALFLLLIPIFIHLFQLRRFQKIDFTNVAFLKKVTLQTRKSSQIKKWLTLLMRLLAFACIIIAFAQPFKASKTASNSEKETTLYIDNSFSMQAKGQEGSLLDRTLQQLYARSTGNEKISWFTNNTEKKNVSAQDFKNEVLSIGYTQNQLSPKDIILKSEQMFSKSSIANKQLIIISDFQRRGDFPDQNEELNIDVVWLKPVKNNNISIDTAYISKVNSSSIELKVKINSLVNLEESIPVSLYNNDRLIAKSAVSFTNELSTIIAFDIENYSGFKGKLEINEPNLQFDNTLFFNINKKEKIKILSINEADSNFLQRIFNPDEFEYQQQGFNELNYSEIPSQNLIILNELKTIPGSLGEALRSFIDNGGSLLILPAIETELKSFNSFLNKLKLGVFSEKITQEKKITQIIFDHPIYKDVFEKHVVNFQYPKVNSYYQSSLNASSILNFEDGRSFISQKDNMYLSTAPLNTDNSNFQNSPLIVPTIYNIAKNSLPLPELYYTVGNTNTYAIPVKLVQDKILTLSDSVSNMIPLQQTKANQVIITTNDEPDRSGIYSVMKEKEILEQVSYNYHRNESVLQYSDPNDWKGVTIYNTIDDLFDKITNDNSIKSYWKWFVIFALLFLLFEMLILKFYK